ncbi:hypothetical protein ACO0SA_001132 [Hanseniaspora valbyensis]
MFNNLLRSNSKLITRNNLLLRQKSAYRYLSFKVSDKYKLPKQNSGAVEGSINDDLKKPEIDYSKGGFHWNYEKIVSAALIPFVSLPFYSYFVLGNLNIDPMMDAVLSTLILIHVSYGYESCIVDYIPKRKFGYWHDVCKRLLQAGGILSLYGIFIMETENNGLTNLVRRLWTAKSADAEENR